MSAGSFMCYIHEIKYGNFLYMMRNTYLGIHQETLQDHMRETIVDTKFCDDHKYYVFMDDPNFRHQGVHIYDRNGYFYYDGCY